MLGVLTAFEAFRLPRVNETSGNRSGLTGKPVTGQTGNRANRFGPVTVRAGYGLGRYQTGPNSKFKFEFRKNEKFPKNF